MEATWEVLFRQAVEELSKTYTDSDRLKTTISFANAVLELARDPQQRKELLEGKHLNHAPYVDVADRIGLRRDCKK